MNTKNMRRSTNLREAGITYRPGIFGTIMTGGRAILRDIQGTNRFYPHSIKKNKPLEVMKHNPAKDWRVLGLKDPALSLLKGKK